MTFISHAQNREDVLLWRALRHVRGGFYVDVGANHPSHDSVTKSFYDRGWSGINIEPLREHYEELARVRLRDVNLQVAAGAQEGEIDLYDSDVRGLATASLEVAEARRAAGGVVRQCRVPVQRLDTILAAHAPEQIHFLKVDVEGFEASVLQGIDLTRWRPWLVVVEATKPNSQDLELGWEPLLTDSGYRFVWFDGLNRYYVADERMSLAEHFVAPPNVFDDFVPAEQERLRLALEKSQLDLRAFKEEVVTASHELEQAEKFRSELDAVVNSLSWRLTRPLRLVARALRALKKKVARHKLGGPEAKDAGPGHDSSVSLEGSFQSLSHGPSKPRFTYWHENVLGKHALAPRLLEAAQGGPELWWRLTGHLEGHYSLAEVNRSLATELDQLSQGRLRFVPWHGQGFTPKSVSTNALEQMVGRALPEGSCVVSLVHHYPPMSDPEASQLRLVMFFWEESLVPKAVVDLLNSGSDGVLVASRFVKRVLRHSGCDRPIFVVPLGVRGAAEMDPSVKRGSSDGRFRFLHVSSAFERKGVDVLLRAYGETFDGDDAVELYLKTFANPHHDIGRQVSEWRAGLTNPPPVTLDVSELNEGEMDALYRSASAMVLPTRGEGFGLPQARALAMGTPLITTAGGGQSDFASLEFAGLVPYRCAPSRSHVNEGDAHWLEPDAHLLGVHMESVWNRARNVVNQEELGPLLASSERQGDAPRWMAERYGWGECALHVDAIARRLLQAPATQSRRQRLAVVSPWHTTCGIAEYAQALFAGWQEHFDVRVYCDHRTTADPSQSLFVPSWVVGRQSGVLELLDALCQQAESGLLDVLCVQHQQSLFLLTDEVCTALGRIRAHGVRVIVELHSTLPMVREGRIGRVAAQALRGLDLVVVHKVDDVNCMLGLGLAENVMCLPLAVASLDAPLPESARDRFGFAQADLVLGCFGILWPHKGVEAVVRSMPLLAQASGRRVKLLAVTAVIDEASSQTLAECQSVAQALGVETDIVWVTDFLPLEESLRCLGVADVQLFVYGPTRESASGAVTVGLATHRPVLVSPQEIFSDLSACTYRLEGTQPSDVVRGVTELLASPHTESTVYANQRSWLASRSWSHASQRLRAAIRGLDEDRRHPQVFESPNFESDPELVPERMQGSKRGLLVDVTQIAKHDTGTGIQRVVRNILREWLLSPPKGYEVLPVRFDEASGAYCHARAFTGGVARANGPELGVEPVRVGVGDVFVGLDLTAHLFPAAEALLTRWRVSGVRVCYVVYDIIPLQHPELAYPGTPEAFGHWARSLRRQCDRAVCISRSVADELRLWWCAHTEEGALPEISHFRLGAGLEHAGGVAPEPGEGGVGVASESVRQAELSGAVLMVGTVEPRKGHAQALDAFEVLWAGGGSAPLVIAGAAGWDVGPLCDRIRSHPELGRRLFWFESADDASLAHLYANCAGLLMASMAEGFGLPLVEAAHHGLPILARDIDVFREIAGPFATYFGTEDAHGLRDDLAAWLGVVERGEAPQSSGVKATSWQESAAQLLAEVL